MSSSKFSFELFFFWIIHVIRVVFCDSCFNNCCRFCFFVLEVFSLILWSRETLTFQIYKKNQICKSNCLFLLFCFQFKVKELKEFLNFEKDVFLISTVTEIDKKEEVSFLQDVLELDASTSLDFSNSVKKTLN